MSHADRQKIVSSQGWCLQRLPEELIRNRPYPEVLQPAVPKRESYAPLWCCSPYVVHLGEDGSAPGEEVVLHFHSFEEVVLQLHPGEEGCAAGEEVVLQLHSGVEGAVGEVS